MYITETKTYLELLDILRSGDENRLNTLCNWLKKKRIMRVLIAPGKPVKVVILHTWDPSNRCWKDEEHYRVKDFSAPEIFRCINEATAVAPVFEALSPQLLLDEGIEMEEKWTGKKKTEWIAPPASQKGQSLLNSHL